MRHRRYRKGRSRRGAEVICLPLEPRRLLSMSMIKDIDIDTDSSAPGSFLDVGGILYFAATDGVSGGELWRSDGTPAGTFLVADIAPGKQTSNPQPMAALD